jgi:hypothetical protein
MVSTNKFHDECRKMVEHIYDLTAEFPQEDCAGCGYWHMHLPTSSATIDSPRTPKSVRKTCIQTLIDRTNHLCILKPTDDVPTHAVAAINLPNLFDAQIIVFFGSDYFARFFDRNSPQQCWIPLPDHRSLVKEWKLSIPNGFIERGYREIIQDEDFSHDGEIWFIGELDR